MIEKAAKELARLQQAKLDIAEAIDSKGVTVEASDLFSDFAALIEQISQEIPSEYGLVTYTAINPALAEIKVS